MDSALQSLKYYFKANGQVILGCSIYEKKKKNFVFGKVDKLKRFQKARRYIFMYIL